MPTNPMKVWNDIEKELRYVATYASIERREELFRFLKGQFEIIASSQLDELKNNIQQDICRMAGVDKAGDAFKAARTAVFGYNPPRTALLEQLGQIVAYQNVLLMIERLTPNSPTK